MTGGGRGIALALAKYDAHVAIMARSSGEIEAVAAKIEAQDEGSLAVSGDASQHRDVIPVVQTVQDRFGKIDILINNTGIIGPIDLLERTDPEHWVLYTANQYRSPLLFYARSPAGYEAARVGTHP